MAYSEDFRKRVNEYLDEGHTQREARTTFKINMTAINSWRQKYKKAGEVKDEPPRRKAFKKPDSERLKSYVNQHPDAYLKEYCQSTEFLTGYQISGDSS